VVHPHIKLASIKDQSLFCGDVTDDKFIDYHGTEVGRGNFEELAEEIKGLVAWAYQAGLSQDGVRSLQLVSESKNIFRLKLSVGSSANLKLHVIKVLEVSDPCV
jgi:hypothetical protein